MSHGGETTMQSGKQPGDTILPYSVHDNTPIPLKMEEDVDEHEVFQQVEDGVAFRTVGWFRASVMFLKVMIAVGVLSLPTTMNQLGAVGGALGIVAFGLFNTYCFVIFGNFRKSHRGCHTVADMAGVVGGWVSKEVTGILFIVAFLLSTSAGIVGLSTGFNALSHHSACTVWWNLIAMIIIALVSSMRKLYQIGWVTYVGFVSIYAAVFIVVVGVTQRSRPAAAPQTGDFDLGFQVIAYPTFAVGMVGASTIFYSSAGISAFLPIMSEMRRPQDYKKALYLCMTIVTTSYLAFTTVIYKYCGSWIANPSLGSAGQTIKMVAYGVAIPGLVASGCIFCHVSSKYIFVRILRDSPHLQKDTRIHWATWLGSVAFVSIFAFIFAEVIPIFNYILSLTGAVCFAPLGIILPGWLWLYDHGHYRRGSLWGKTQYFLHWGMVAVGLFFLVGATYGVILEINAAYSTGAIGMMIQSCL